MDLPEQFYDVPHVNHDWNQSVSYYYPDKVINMCFTIITDLHFVCNLLPGNAFYKFRTYIFQTEKVTINMMVKGARNFETRIASSILTVTFKTRWVCKI